MKVLVDLEEMQKAAAKDAAEFDKVLKENKVLKAKLNEIRKILRK